MTTACVLFQRFYFVSSMRNFGIRVSWFQRVDVPLALRLKSNIGPDTQDIAGASLFLASKLEEHPIRIRDLINCFDYLLRLVAYEGKRLDAKSNSNGHSPALPATSSFVYKPMDYFAKEFYDWKDDLVIGESQILKVCCLQAYTRIQQKHVCSFDIFA